MRQKVVNSVKRIAEVRAGESDVKFSSATLSALRKTKVTGQWNISRLETKKLQEMF